ncbi:twin-arginine translocase subunit TatC [Marisediminicola sp. LYQ134]|uniref:twin-arginine translocase subunit TatC n=1 Tax=unclassified Marisediminicola TaxID=2618316 RepID=UPI003982FB66
MSLAQHLLELRKRLFRSALAVLVAAIVGFIVAPFVLALLREPITQLAGEAQLNYDSLTGPFDLRVQIAITVGIVLASPVWLYQIFAYVTPALTRTEKRYTFGFFFSAVPLFLVGCAAGFFIFPEIVSVLARFAPPEDSTILLSKYYVDFALKLILAVGVAFVLPVFVVLLNFMGVISAKAILTGWRWAILSITVFCAFATPAADVFSMFLLAIPMIGLYFAAVGIAWMRDRVVARRRARLVTEGAPL